MARMHGSAAMHGAGVGGVSRPVMGRAGAVEVRMRQVGVEFAALAVCAGWEVALPSLRGQRGLVALALSKTVMNAWATSRRSHDSRELPCVFVCGADAGGCDAFRHCMWCDVLWQCAERCSGVPQRNPVLERLALGDIDRAVQLRALRGEAFAFRLYHVVKGWVGGGAACGFATVGRAAGRELTPSAPTRCLG